MALAASLPLYRLDVATYGRMVDSGALDGVPVELLDGLLIEVSPQGPAHAHVITRLTRHLSSANDWVRVQLPLEVPPDSTPEPDLALVEGEFLDRHPRTAVLVVEVASSSYAIDSEQKSDIYARAGVPTYWLVDLQRREVVVHTDPLGGAYRTRTVHHRGETLAPPAAGVAPLALADLFAGLD